MAAGGFTLVAQQSNAAVMGKVSQLRPGSQCLGQFKLPRIDPLQRGQVQRPRRSPPLGRRAERAEVAIVDSRFRQVDTELSKYLIVCGTALGMVYIASRTWLKIKTASKGTK